MGKLVSPKVFLVGYTTIDRKGLLDYLQDSGNEDFVESIQKAREEGLSEGEILCSFYAKLCYNSLSLGHNLNISRTRDISDNLRACFSQGHFSIFEHCTLNFVVHNCSRVFEAEMIRHRVGTSFCLAGDSVIYMGRGKSKGKWNGVKKRTIYSIYCKSVDKNHRIRSRVKLMNVRCYDGEQFVSARIKGITKSGIKPVYKMTLTDGKFIRCSKDHLILSKSDCGEEWKSLENLSVGDVVATNGRKINPPSKNDLKRMWLDDNMTKKEIADVFGVSGDLVAKWTQVYKLKKVGDGHHKDRNHWNDSEDNIETLCNSCHRKRHNLEDVNGNTLVVRWVGIESIVLDGEEMTYDLEIDHPSHNFVSNGIVVHNSISSGRYVRSDSIDIVFDPILEPVRYRISRIQNFLEDEYAAMVEEMGLDKMSDFAQKKKLTSALRRIMPEGKAKEVGVGINLRALRHIIQLRTSRHAEYEIRNVFGQVYKIVKSKYPLIFYGAKEEEVDGLLEVSGMKQQPYEQDVQH